MDSRALIFTNLLNGVPVWQVARDFQKSENDVEAIFQHVLRKVKSYCFIRARGFQQPIAGTKLKVPAATQMVIADTIAEAQRYKLTCLSVLPHLDLDKDAQFKRIFNETVTVDNVESVARELRA